MSEEVKSTLKYLKNKNNTRRIKAITITEAQKVVEEIERLNNKVEELMELYTTERHCKDDYKAIINEAIEYIETTSLGKGTEYYRIKLLEILDKENK